MQRETPLHVMAVHSLAQRMNQETSTPSKASPYMGRMQPLRLSLLH